MRGAYVDAMADAAGSVGVIVAAVVIATDGVGSDRPHRRHGHRRVDPAARVAARRRARSACCCRSRPSTSTSTRSAPSCMALPGVVDVHDLHVWTLTSEMDVASAHVMVGPDADAHGVLDQARVAPARARDRARHHPGGARRPRRVRRAQLVTGAGRCRGRRAGARRGRAGDDGRSRNAAATASPAPSPSVSVTSSRANPAENVLGTWELPEAGDVGEAAGDEQEDGGHEHQRHRRLGALAPDPPERRAARGRCRPSE